MKIKSNNITPDQLAIRFERIHGYELDYDNPRTYNEKLFWRMAFDRNPLFPVLADKYRVKKYIQKKSMVKAVPTKQTFPFFLKINNRCGGSFIVTDLYSYQITINRIIEQSHQPYGIDKGEWWYGHIPLVVMREVIVKRFIEVKLLCFHGRVEYILLMDGPRKSYFTRDGDYLDIKGVAAKSPVTHLPDIRNAVECGDLLSKDIDHVRVDLLITKNHMYFGEYTLAHSSGRTRWSDPDFDRRLGEHWNLP